MKRKEQNLRVLWNTIKHTNVCTLGDPIEREKGKIRKHIRIFVEVLSENFPNLMKDMKTIV
jgi:hypothetical protein